MKRDEDLLRCSFCGKSQKAVKKLIAGPSVWICNECVTICDQILDDEGIERDTASQKSTQHMARALADLDAAQVLIASGHHRPAITILKGAVRAALQGYFFARDGQCYADDIGALLGLALGHEARLRRIEGLDLACLISDLDSDSDIEEGEAQRALAGSKAIVEYVRDRVEAA